MRRKAEVLARNIVYQICDELDIPTEQRQETNDWFIDFAKGLILDFIHARDKELNATIQRMKIPDSRIEEAIKEKDYHSADIFLGGNQAYAEVQELLLSLHNEE